MAEVNLLKNYPQARRNLDERAQKKTVKIRSIARKFGKEFFDGDRIYGYGGFSYHLRFWLPVIPDFVKYYGLTSKSRILDVGCAKGFMLYDFIQLVPGIDVRGIDISEYAITNSLPKVKPFLQVGNAKKLPFPDKSFDLVISINTVHNLPEKQCIKAIQEIQRVTKKNAFLTVDAYRSEAEKNRMFDWNLTAKSIMSVGEWKKLFKKIGYTGDYYWFIP